MKLKMKGLLKQTEFYVFCIIRAQVLFVNADFNIFAKKEIFGIPLTNTKPCATLCLSFIYAL